MVVILMGVSGSGKTFIGERLAAELDWSFYEGDDYHPQSNVEKMSQGVALTDADRAPWLDALHVLIGKLLAQELHIRRPLTRTKNRRVDRLIGLARELLEEED
jgi:gluconokinase